MIFYLLLLFLRIIKPSRKRKRRIAIEFNRNKKPEQRAAAPPARTQAQIERQERQQERQRQQDQKRAAQIEQAEIDIPFYESQLDDYARMHRDAAKLLDAAQSEVDTDNALNEHGAVISIKVHSKHVAARDRYKKAVLQYERQIHTAQKQLDKAKRILNDTGYS